MALLDHQEFRRQGHMVIDMIADYYRDVENYPVRSQVEPGYLRRRLPEAAPEDPEPIETILHDVQKHIVPGITHWQSPNYFAYFPSSGSIPGFLGEILSTGFNIVGFNWMSSPAATELESIVMDWLGKMLKLPQSFLFSGGGGGVIHGTTCEAILCTLVAARDKMLAAVGRDNILKLVVYSSDQTHCALQKAAQIAGIHPGNVRVIPTKRSAAFALSPRALRSAIVSDVEAGMIPLFLCATVGTTSSTAVDPVGALCEVAKEYEVWVHVDAAYAGSACICPEFRHFIDGVEGANSVSLNAHKWFFTNLDCCCLWTKDPTALVKSLSTNPEYLKNAATNSKRVVDYKDWQIALSRRFRAMKLWMVLRSYGVSKLRSFLRSHVEMAKHFEGLVGKDKRFEVVVPRYFATVCFRLKSQQRSAIKAATRVLVHINNGNGNGNGYHANGNGNGYHQENGNGYHPIGNGNGNGNGNGYHQQNGKGYHPIGNGNGNGNGYHKQNGNGYHPKGNGNGNGYGYDDDDEEEEEEKVMHVLKHENGMNSKLLESINATGRVFMTHAVVGGVYTLRFAVGASLTQLKHVDVAWQLVQQHADAIFSAEYYYS